MPRALRSWLWKKSSCARRLVPGGRDSFSWWVMWLPPLLRLVQQQLVPFAAANWLPLLG